jgi:hypothetical protein
LKTFYIKEENMKVYKDTKRKIDVQYGDCGLSKIGWNPCSEESEDYGFSLYKHVYIKWGRKRNAGILDVLDGMNEYTLDMLIACWECNGGVSFLWRDLIPHPWDKRRVLEAKDGNLVSWKTKEFDNTEQYVWTEDKNGGRGISDPYRGVFTTI